MSPALLEVLRRYSCPVDFTDVHPRRADSDGPLHLAAMSGNRADVQLLLENGARVNEPGEMNFTPLHCALMWRHDVVLVELLLAKGADVRAVNEFGDTPWMMVLKRRNELPRRAFAELKKLLRA
ncbi:MAG: ankyrin repeat domain-containing protein [Archangium sp.]